MKTWNENFFNMIDNTIKHGLTSHTYDLRANTLYDFHQIILSKESGLYVLDCVTQVAVLARKLFVNYASVTEKLTCLKCSHNYTKKLTGMLIQDHKLEKMNADNFMLEACKFDNSFCLRCEKSDTVKHTLEDIGM